MSKFKRVIETLYICFGLMFFSKELVYGGTGKIKSDFNNCGISI